MRAIGIHLQNCHTQTGITRRPLLAWHYAARDAGQRQAAYHIRVFSGDALCHDTGPVASARQNNILLDFPLKTHTCYQVMVGITNQCGQTEWGGPAMFVSGVCSDSEWQGGWISNKTAKPYYAGKRFNVARPVRQAYISACGLGQFKLLLNGEPVGIDVLAGSWTDFNKRVHYWTYDVANQLKGGLNDIVMEVGNGWYIGDTSEDRHFYPLKMGYVPYGRYLPCILLLTLRYCDGTAETILTGSDWWTHPSPTTLANIYGSEDYDARLALPFDRLCKAAKDKAFALAPDEIPKGRLAPALHPPVAIKHCYNPVDVRTAADGGMLYDFGQNMSGLFEVTAEGNPGDVLEMTAVEKLDSNGQPLPTCNTWCRYTLAGKGAESWRPAFTYQAGRWLHIRRISAQSGPPPKILGVKAYFITSSVEDTGTFACSDARIMQIHDLIVKAAESNMNHVHTDCPTVERLGWLEPNHLMGPSLMYMKNVNTLWDKIAADMRDSQYPEGEYDVDRGVFAHRYGPGLIPSVAPRYARFLTDFGDGSFWDIIPWGSSILLAAACQQIFYGNTETAEKNYAAAVRYLAYLYDKYLHYNDIYGKTGEEKYLCHGLGDWGFPVKGDEGRENVETAFLYYDYVGLAQVARRLGRRDEAQAHEKRAEDILAVYNKYLLQFDVETGRWYYQMKGRSEATLTQTNQALPLCLGMVPEDKRRDVEQSFLETVRGGHFCAGEVGLPFVFETLARLGLHDVIYEMILQPRHPSYYRFVLNGETTLPEFWDDNARSRCHDMMGSIFAWFYQGLGGISSNDAFTNIRIAPNLPGNMEWVHCRYKAITGEIEVRFEKKALGYALRITLPPNTEGTLQLPEGFALKETTGGQDLGCIRLFSGTTVFALTAQE